MFVKRGLKEVKEVCFENTLGGRETLHIWQLLGDNGDMVPGDPTEFGSDIHFFCDMVLDVGGLVGTHRHADSEETYYILSGKARMVIDGTTIDIGEGDAVNTQVGSEHSIENIGDIPLRFIAVEGGVDINK